MERDGNGWVECALGHRHWGRFGAAGLLLHAVDDDGVARVLMQLRSDWSHHGDTWGLPGGARDSHEDAVAAALREAAEETGLDPARPRVRHLFVDDHGGWAYTTVYADTASPLPTVANDESVALEWVPVGDVAQRRLHPGFGHTWQVVAAHPVTVLVDAANVVGSRPDGWWHDRAGAAARLLRGLDSMRSVVTEGPQGAAVVVARVVVVVEGEARQVGDPAWARVTRATGSGDDALVSQAKELERQTVVAVTADRALRTRLLDVAPSIQLTGPSWLAPWW